MSTAMPPGTAFGRRHIHHELFGGDSFKWTKWRMSSLCIFLGAGFSRWACGLPLASELFDFNIHCDSEIESRRLERLGELLEGWLSRNREGHPERFIAFAQERPRSRFLVNWYVVRRLTDQFVSTSGRRKTFYINSGRARSHLGVAKARELFDRMAILRDISVVTTNYDLLPEYSFGLRGMNYGKVGEQIGWTPHPYIKPVFATGNVAVAKLHGSVSWSESGSKLPDARFGLTGRCLIVPPISEKTPPPALDSQWTLAEANLAAANVLLVFGFSFNDNDLAVRRLVTSGLRPSTKIVLVDAVDHRARLGFLTSGRQVDFVHVIGKSDTQLIAEIEAALPSQGDDDSCSRAGLP